MDNIIPIICSTIPARYCWEEILSASAISKALIKGLETGKVGAAGLDVIEDEFGLYYKDLKSKCLSKHDLCILRSFPNVVVTPHMAFYTDQAVSDMVKNSILSCCLNERGEENPWEVK